jgi:hypothetical protein
MTCRELLGKFTEALERDEVDWVLLNKLVKKCGPSFALEAGRAFAKKVVQAAASRAWALYRGAVIAGKDPAIAYGQAVEMIWRLWDWFSIQCSPLADISAYVAKAVSKHKGQPGGRFSRSRPPRPKRRDATCRTPWPKPWGPTNTPSSRPFWNRARGWWRLRQAGGPRW